MEAKMMFRLFILTLMLLLSTQFFFIVDESELAIKFQLGEFAESEYAPGIHFQIPMLQKVIKFDRRIITLDAQPVPYLTLEKKNLLVDSYIKWRIANVALYYRSMRGSETNATERLSKIVQDGLRNEFAKRTIQEAISGDRSQIMSIMAGKISDQVKEYGIEVVDVRIQRVELPAEVSESVYQRMRAERQRVAMDLRSRGAEAAEKLRANADRQATVILAEAYRDSERLRGEGDALSANIYAKAFGQNREFYEFYRSLDAYQQAFQSKEDLLLLDSSSEFFRYFKDLSGIVPAH